MGLESQVSRRTALVAMGVGIAMVMTKGLSISTVTSSSDRPFQLDWLMLNHGRSGNGGQMQAIKEKIVAQLPELVDPAHILTPNYPDPSNPNLNRWMNERMDMLTSLVQKHGEVGWMWDYSASAPVGLSALGMFGHTLPLGVRESLRLRIIAGGIRGRTNLYDLVNQSGFESLVKPNLGGGIDHLHAYADSVITKTSATDLATKFGYLDRLRFVSDSNHSSILRRDELITSSMLGIQENN